MAGLGRDRRPGSQVRRTGIVIAIVIALALVVFQTSRRVRDTVTPVRAGMDDIIIQSASTVQKPGFFSFGDSALRQELEALRQQNRQLAIWRDTATAMGERMLRYEELLGLDGEPFPAGVSARVVTETESPFAETRLANAGARNGIEIGHVAVNTRGVIGRVIRVGNRSSRILLVSDYNSRVPIMGEISGVRAMLAGGSGDDFGQLVDKPERADFIAGENLLTTGEGNAFPRGLRVGVAVQRDDAWQAQLALAEAPLDFVRLLPPLSIAAPEDDPIVPVQPDTVASTAPDAGDET